MKKIRVRFVNLEDMVGFIKAYDFIMHQYFLDLDILEIYTDLDIRDALKRRRGTIVSIEDI